MLGGCGRRGFDARDDGALGADTAILDAPPADAPFDVNVAFVTSTVQAPTSLGGVAGADAVCNGLAEAAGLPGTYLAWLPTSAETVPVRLAAARGWVRRDGRPVADTIAELLAGGWYPIDIDEAGAIVRSSIAPGSVVATATHRDGSADASDCAGYTPAGTGQSVITGLADFGRGMWLDATSASCDTPMRLYCFGIDHTRPVVAAAPGSRRAFVSSAAFVNSTGLAGADALCQGDATAANLMGTFRALLADVGTTAISRFATTGAPWARVDGVLLASTPAAFAAAITLAPLELSADGVHVASSTVTTGAPSPSAPGSTASTCAGWTSSGTGETRTISPTGSAALFADLTTTCVVADRVYCLEP